MSRDSAAFLGGLRVNLNQQRDLNQVELLINKLEEYNATMNQLNQIKLNITALLRLNLDKGNKKGTKEDDKGDKLNNKHNKARQAVYESVQDVQ